MNKTTCLSLLGMLLSFIVIQAQNPFFTHMYTADGTIREVVPTKEGVDLIQ